MATKTEELTILNSIAEALNSAPDVQRALERTLALVTDLLGLHTGWIWLLDPETNKFYSAAAQNLPPYLREPVRMTGRSCWCIEDFTKGKLTPKNIDVIECSRLQPAVKAKAVNMTRGLRYHASIPLYFQEKPLGILNVTGPSWRRLTKDELRLLSTIAYQVGIAIERARLAEESARLARVEERARIAREIHDTLAQGLTAIALHLEGAIHHVGKNPDRVRQRLERALAMARSSLEEARESVVNLRAAPLAGKPLAEALGALARAFTSETGVRVYVEAPEALTLPLRTEAELFRIVQEALANVRKHAKATEVRITLAGGARSRGAAGKRARTRRGDAIRLVIRDDGVGFDPAAISAAAIPDSGQGVLGMRERARLLGGRLRVESRPGHGTRITAAIPLPEDDR
ncbi:MAG: histidine kinase [bacterium]